MNPVTHQAVIQALRNRAHSGMLIAAVASEPASFIGWRAYAKALADLQSPAGQKLAAKDAQSGGYEPAGCLKAAWTRLPVDIETLAMAEVQEFLTAQGVQIPLDAVPALQVDAVEQFDSHTVAVINPNDKHAPAVVDLNDGSSNHGASLVMGVDVQVSGIVTSKGAKP